jgi:hypothetical protein
MLRLLLIGMLTTLAFALAQPAAAKAPDVTSDTDVISLGFRRGPDGRLVQGLQIIHYRQGFGKPPGTPGGGSGGGGSTCYAFLANGAKWKGAEPYVVDPSNNEGLNNSDVTNAVATAIGAWESAASDNDIFGGASTGNLTLNLSNLNNVNEVAFGNYTTGGVIAVTNVWGYFNGPTSRRELVEWDMMIDTDFTWSNSGEPGKMDLLNILTHEIGHAMGLGHPSDSCTEETMFRFADNGETKKQTLEAGDKAGIRALYPAP